MLHVHPLINVVHGVRPIHLLSHHDEGLGWLSVRVDARCLHVVLVARLVRGLRRKVVEEVPRVSVDMQVGFMEPLIIRHRGRATREVSVISLFRRRHVPLAVSSFVERDVLPALRVHESGDLAEEATGASSRSFSLGLTFWWNVVRVWCSQCVGRYCPLDVNRGSLFPLPLCLGYDLLGRW